MMPTLSPGRRTLSAATLPRVMRLGAFSVLLALFSSGSLLAAQTDSTPPAPAADASAANPRARRGNFNPADLQTRLLGNLRDQLGIKDDAEWAIVSARIKVVMDLRRGARGTGAANSEQDALRTAVTDHLPDAEITARLAALRATRQQNATKLSQAQEDLRAVLAIRQEAVAVLAGLLS